jgi:hypothetical protein
MPYPSWYLPNMYLYKLCSILQNILFCVIGYRPIFLKIHVCIPGRAVDINCCGLLRAVMNVRDHISSENKRRRYNSTIWFIFNLVRKRNVWGQYNMYSDIQMNTACYWLYRNLLGRHEYGRRWHEYLSVLVPCFWATDVTNLFLPPTPPLVDWETPIGSPFVDSLAPFPTSI